MNNCKYVAYIEESNFGNPKLLPVGEVFGFLFGLWRTLMRCQMKWHLARLNEEAFEMVEALVEQFADKQGIDERLKVSDQLRWIREMNNCKAIAEEIVLREMIFR